MDPENIHYDNEGLHHDSDDGGPSPPPGRESVGEAASNIAAGYREWGELEYGSAVDEVGMAEQTPILLQMFGIRHSSTGRLNSSTHIEAEGLRPRKWKPIPSHHRVTATIVSDSEPVITHRQVLGGYSTHQRLSDSCENLCSLNCTCLGLFHDNSSGSCYLLENHLGSIIASSTTNRMGYIKAQRVTTSASPYGKNDSRGYELTKKEKPFPIAGLVLIPSSGFLLITLVGIVCYRKRKSRNSLIELEIDGIPGLPVRFGYKELVAATENFRTQIGSGGFGTVYKGTLPGESTGAVKKITSLGVEGKREFCTEIAIIGNIRHVNLVRLKGFCAQGRQLFLVYEYMNRGSLDRVLFGNGCVLEWEERFKIALGTAQGLAYLHSSCEQKIIYCDVKPENILLDDNLHVKISDFGISKLLSREQSGLFTTMRGTRGYLAPEWLSNSPITDKSDVYSYGMVLLEIVRGRKNWSLQIHNGNTENDQSSSLSGLEHSTFFPLFALEMHKQRQYLELVDSRLEGRVTSEEEVEKLVRVALCCVHQDPALRPSMANVVGMLEGGYSVGVLRVESLIFLPFFGQRRTEVPRIEAHNVQNGLALFPQANASSNSSSSGSHNSFSYMSSQQVSGPR
ncbi:hypothetical protein RHSIM_RhsimUnG0047300 [Rhododendron simsii]|uniref:Protein kinase domain-containing protein n=1 Tax=Rhododendron simsii TaxID=118357 RepID=A0A834FVR4_RHOSS|nr:hypothetical protein RHSIM_RhsimUnG0047300 [Rhododendron simsii]